MVYKPKISWMIEAYKKLSREYKKNVKKLYVVHPSWWFKVVLWVMQNIVSSKFAKKIVNVEKLADLAVHLPMGSVVVPELVKMHDEKKGNPPATGSSLGTPGNRARERTGVRHSARRRGDVIFGASLIQEADAPGGEAASVNEEIPDPVLSLIEYIHAYGIAEEGIFRKSPSTTDIIELKDRLDRGIIEVILRTGGRVAGLRDIHTSWSTKGMG